MEVKIVWYSLVIFSALGYLVLFSWTIKEGHTQKLDNVITVEV